MEELTDTQLWAVMRLMKTGDSNLGLEINLASYGMAGMIPVFKKYRDAEKYAEGAQVVAIRCDAAMKAEGGERGS